MFPRPISGCLLLSISPAIGDPVCSTCMHAHTNIKRKENLDRRVSDFYYKGMLPGGVFNLQYNLNLCTLGKYVDIWHRFSSDLDKLAPVQTNYKLSEDK